MAPDPQIFNAGTMGEMTARLNRWARERLDPDVCNDAINDALESLWQTVSLATLSRFTGSLLDQTVLSGFTSLPIVSVPDPTDYLQVAVTPGGGLPERTISFGFSLVTDSASQTKMSPAQVSVIPAANLSVCLPPSYQDQTIGWNLFAGVAGRYVQQNIAPLPFETNWVEPPTGISSAPDGPYPQPFNNTADNIQSIRKISARNQVGTRSQWQQGDIASTLFAEMESRLPSVSTFTRRAYDFLDNRTIEIRPSGLNDISVDLYFLVRPRRLRFPQSRLPSWSFAYQGYLRHECLSDILLSLSEDEEAQVRAAKAERERERISLSILNESWNKNNRVSPFRSPWR